MTITDSGTSPPMSTCKNGHYLSKAGMIWTGTHYQCHACRRASVAAAQSRYAGTAKGILARVRENARTRGA